MFGGFELTKGLHRNNFDLMSILGVKKATEEQRQRTSLNSIPAPSTNSESSSTRPIPTQGTGAEPTEAHLIQAVSNLLIGAPLDEWEYKLERALRNPRQGV